jgi:hypothetical protein
MKRGLLVTALLFATSVVLPAQASAWGFSRNQAPSVCAEDILANCPVDAVPAPDFRILLGLCVSMLNACHEDRMENPGFLPSCAPKVAAFCGDACPDASLCSEVP